MSKRGPASGWISDQASIHIHLTHNSGLLRLTSATVVIASTCMCQAVLVSKSSEPELRCAPLPGVRYGVAHGNLPASLPGMRHGMGRCRTPLLSSLCGEWRGACRSSPVAFPRGSWGEPALNHLSHPGVSQVNHLSHLHGAALNHLNQLAGSRWLSHWLNLPSV